MRPTIICHMTTSIDGRLHPSRFTVPAEGISRDVLRGHYAKVYEFVRGRRLDRWPQDHERNGQRVRADIANAPKVPREPHLANRNGRKLAIGIDPSGRAHYGKDNVQGDHVVAVLGEQVSDAYLAELREDGVSYLFAGQKGDDLPGAMEQLGSLFGVKKLLLEGGAKINGAFFKHRLIDEFSTLIYAAIDGVAGTQTIMEYEGPEGDRPGAGQALRLTHCEALEGGMVWLRHAVERAPVSAS